MKSPERSPTPPPSPSTGLALAAASAPFAGLLFSMLSILVALGRDTMDAVQVTGLVAPLLGVLAGATSVIAALLLFFAGRGVAIPSVVPLACAGLPWIAGLAGLRYSTALVVDALAYADPLAASRMAPVGLGESLLSRAFGAALAAGVIGGTALGLALAALAQRAPGRKGLAGVLGALLGVLVMGGALAGPLFARADFALVLWMAGTFGAIPTLALALAAPGDDAKGRSGAMASAAALGVLVALIAQCAAAESVQASMALRAVGNVDPASVAAIVARGFTGVEGVSSARALGAVAGSLALLVTLAWSVLRHRLSLGALAGGVVLALGALFALGLDAFAADASSARLSEMSGTWWLARDDVRPSAVSGRDEPPRDVDLVLRRDDVIAWDGRTVPASADALGPLVQAALARVAPRAAGLEQPPSWPEDEAAGADAIEDQPALVVMPDAGASAAAWRALITAATRAGARSIVLEGVPGAPNEDAWRWMREARARRFLSATVPRRSYRRVLLETALPEGHADRDTALWHATIGAAGEITPVQRAGGEGERWSSGHEGVVYVALDDQATSESIARALEALERAQVVLVAGAIPGHPERAPFAPDVGSAGPEDLGTIAGGPPREGATPVMAEIGTGDPDVRGSLSREVIRRVIRQHLSEVRSCYERGLVQRPTLTGRVTVQFVVSPTGAVSVASLSSSTLGEPSVEACIVRAVHRWTFPAPEGGGVVAITYPFVLSTE